MEPQLSETAEPLRVVWSAQSWRTFFSTTRLISGWRGHTRTSRGVGMQTMDWCTAVTSKKLRRLSLSYKFAWQSAAWRCIQRKPKSSIAKTRRAKAHIQTSNLTFLENETPKAASLSSIYGPGELPHKRISLKAVLSRLD